MMEYYSAIKRMNFCHLQQHGWTWGALLSEIRQRERQILYDTSLLCGTPQKYNRIVNITKKKQTHRYKERTGGYHWGKERRKRKERGRGLQGTNNY